MSTKGLMADKRVAEVTLNSAGKADTLTLAPGWTYNGASGPFKLDNVDHGHKIVKAAVNPNAPGRAARAQKPKAQPSAPGEPYSGPPQPPAHEIKAIRARTDIPEAFIYRIVLVGETREVCGWIRSTREIAAADLRQRTLDTLGSTFRDRKQGDPEKAVARSFRWTAKHEQDARRENTTGCPWPSVFRPGASTKGDAPFEGGA